ncbi:enoyl-CoA hydratase/isomerase family protein [Colwellia sp. PAMC 20917]|uniref:enoyl-CoA hydratase/isomerase family protein n=1 Tax=Colwellia sp. PAMC 20917 TaxID=1816218 RepID=UPI001E2FACE6|nr:enoyl-CoA hydratase-related protein [Colwellia sp. PAMC 20917]
MKENLPQLTDCLLALDNNIATLTFNRHDVRNALTSTAIADDIVTTVEWVNKTATVAVLIITGDGSAFSSGEILKIWLNVVVILLVMYKNLKLVIVKEYSAFH